jgi:hypothetical protein
MRPDRIPLEVQVDILDLQLQRTASGILTVRCPGHAVLLSASREGVEVSIFRAGGWGDHIS